MLFKQQSKGAKHWATFGSHYICMAICSSTCCTCFRSVTGGLQAVHSSITARFCVACSFSQRKQALPSALSSTHQCQIELHWLKLTSCFTVWEHLGFPDIRDSDSLVLCKAFQNSSSYCHYNTALEEIKGIPKDFCWDTGIDGLNQRAGDTKQYPPFPWPIPVILEIRVIVNTCRNKEKHLVWYEHRWLWEILHHNLISMSEVNNNIIDLANAQKQLTTTTDQCHNQWIHLYNVCTWCGIIIEDAIIPICQLHYVL